MHGVTTHSKDMFFFRESFVLTKDECLCDMGERFTQDTSLFNGKI